MNTIYVAAFFITAVSLLRSELTSPSVSLPEPFSLKSLIERSGDTEALDRDSMESERARRGPSVALRTAGSCCDAGWGGELRSGPTGCPCLDPFSSW